MSQRPSSRRARAPFNPAFWTLSSDSLRCSLRERDAGGRGKHFATSPIVLQSLIVRRKALTQLHFWLGETVVTKFASGSLTIRERSAVHGSDICQKCEDSRVAMDHCASTRTEADIIAAILAGNTDLFHDLIRPHERSVYMMALSYMKNEADAEDVTQEAFVKAFRHLSSFRAEAKFSTWLISITLNEAKSRLRRQAIVRMESLDETPDEGHGVTPALLRDWREIPSEAVERLEVRSLIRIAVEDLPDIYRQVFLLRDVEELNVNETATALNISAPAVKVRLHRARIMLQKRLAPQLMSVSPAPKRRWLSWS